MTSTDTRTVHPTTSATSRYATQVSGLMLAALGLSAAYTVWSTATGVVAEGFTATSPGVWAFYAILTAVALWVRSDRTAVWWVLAALLPLLLLVGYFVYPATDFTPEQQTPFGWAENGVYLGLLTVAAYLTVQRLRRRHLEP
jgi:hypothetical protein